MESETIKTTVYIQRDNIQLLRKILYLSDMKKQQAINEALKIGFKEILRKLEN